MTFQIPHTRPRWDDAERAHLAEALARGPVGPGGSISDHCADVLRRTLNDYEVLLTHSASDAAETAALLLDLGPGDEVILPSLARSALAGAAVARTATPCFVDISEDTLTIDPDEVEKAITNRTRLIAVYYHGGLAAPMDRLGQIASYHRLPLVEDLGPGLFGRYRERALGTLGNLAILNFDDNGDGTTGLGGGLALADPALHERAGSAIRGGLAQIDPEKSDTSTLEWIDYGSEAGLDELGAALLKARLGRQFSDAKRRKIIWQKLYDGLEQWAMSLDIRLPKVLPESEPSYCAFHIVMPTADMRDGILRHLRQKGIEARKPGLPLHQSRMGKALGTQPSLCRITEKMVSRLVYLPMRADLTDDEVEMLISTTATRRSLVD